VPDRIRSAVNGLYWPAIPSAPAGSLLALQFQLEQSQWYAAGRLRQLQLGQLRQLLQHAAGTVPFYRKCFATAGFDPAALTPESFARLPLLTRHDIRNSGAALISGSPPADHGRTLEFHSGGSTGEPVKTFARSPVAAAGCFRHVRGDPHPHHRGAPAGLGPARQHGL
jgi:phenylacetate-CoA ligase